MLRHRVTPPEEPPSPGSKENIEIKQPTTHLRLPKDVRKMARLSAAAIERSLSEYVANLIHRDAQRTGIDQLVTTDSDRVTR